MLTYKDGDATLLTGHDRKLLVHLCNDVGGWGAGFVLSLSKRWKEPEMAYRRWYKTQTPKFGLGEAQFVNVSPTLWIANVIAQYGIAHTNEGPPIRYEAVRLGLLKVSKKAKELRMNIHMPRIGCGLAGGRWEQIEPIVQTTLIQAGLSVTVYDFQP